MARTIFPVPAVEAITRSRIALDRGPCAAGSNDPAQCSACGNPSSPPRCSRSSSGTRTRRHRRCKQFRPPVIGAIARRDVYVRPEPDAVGDRRGLRAGAHVELGEDARDVDARGLLGHVQRRADLAVRAPVGEQGQHLALARREPERVFAGIRGGQRGRRRRLVGLQPQPRAQREALDLRGQPRARRSPARRSSASSGARGRRLALAAAPAAPRPCGACACAARYGRPSACHAPRRRPTAPGRRGPGARATSARAVARNAASTGRSPSAHASTRAISPSALAIANAGSSPRSRARTAASASTRTPVGGHAGHPRDVLGAEVEPVQRVVDRARARRRGRRSRRSSSARSEPSGPIHCGSRVSAATSRAWSSSVARRVVLAAAERELDPPQRVVDEGRAHRRAPGRRQRGLGRGPVAGLERQLGAQQHQPAPRRALARRASSSPSSAISRASASRPAPASESARLTCECRQLDEAVARACAPSASRSARSPSS